MNKSVSYDQEQAGSVESDDDPEEPNAELYRNRYIQSETARSAKLADSAKSDVQLMHEFFTKHAKAAREQMNPLRKLNSAKLKSVENWMNQSVSQAGEETEYYVNKQMTLD